MLLRSGAAASAARSPNEPRSANNMLQTLRMLHAAGRSISEVQIFLKRLDVPPQTWWPKQSCAHVPTNARQGVA
jgi:hypothetical protein